MTTETLLESGESDDVTPASMALMLAWVPFVVGGLLVVRAETPPSASPTLGMLTHALWALGTGLLAVGVVGLVRWTPDLRRGLAGYLSVGALGLGVLHGLQWVSWAYVDVRGAAETERDELLVDAIVVPFGASHLLVYAILLGTGVALLGWALRRTERTRPYVGWSGVGLGTLTAGLAVFPLLAAVGGGSEGHLVFDVVTLLLPVLYLWALVVGVSVYRRS